MISMARWFVLHSQLRRDSAVLEVFNKVECVHSLCFGDSLLDKARREAFRMHTDDLVQIEGAIW